MRFAVFVVLLFNIFCASSVNALTLKSVLESAYNNNPELKAARERLRSVDENIMQALSRWLPQVGASKYKANASNSSTDRSGISQSISLQQNLFHGGSDLATFKMAQASVEQGRAELLAAEQKILLSAISVYMNTLNSEEEYKAAEQRLEDSNKFLEVTEKRFKVGENTKIDVASAQASMAEAQAIMVNVSGALEKFRVEFFEITGVRPVNLVEPEFDLQLPETLDAMTQLTMVHNPHVVQFQKNKEHAEYNVDKVRGEQLLPSVTFQYAVQDDRQNKAYSLGYEQPGVINRQATVTLNIPIFNGGYSWSQYRQAKRGFQGNKYAFMNAQNQARTGAAHYWSDHQSKKQSLEFVRERLNASAIAYEGVTKGEKVGLYSVIDVIGVRKDYFNAYSQFLRSKADRLYSGYEVAAQIGQCNAKALNLNVKLYDPFKNYNIIKLQLIGAYNPPQ